MATIDQFVAVGTTKFVILPTGEPGRRRVGSSTSKRQPRSCSPGRREMSETAAQADSATSLFTHEGDRFVATELSRGPWDPRHCHGGPVAALLARSVEEVGDEGGPWQISRLTVELVKPVPVLVPLSLEVVVERPGRKVSLVAAVLRDGSTEVARVRALRIREEHVALPEGSNLATDRDLDPPGRGQRQRVTFAISDEVAFHSHACEHRFLEGSWEQAGPVALWIKLLYPVLEGETPSGLQRTAAAADFGNGVSGSLAYEDFLYINPDLTVHLLRPPFGEWIGMRTSSRYGDLGAGLAESELFDADGRIGRSCQSLFVSAR